MSKLERAKKEEEVIAELLLEDRICPKWGPNGISVPDWIAWLHASPGRILRIKAKIKEMAKERVRVTNKQLEKHSTFPNSEETSDWIKNHVMRGIP